MITQRQRTLESESKQVTNQHSTYMYHTDQYATTYNYFLTLDINKKIVKTIYLKSTKSASQCKAL